IQWDAQKARRRPNSIPRPRAGCRIGRRYPRKRNGMAKGKWQMAKVHVSLREASFFPLARVPQLILEHKIGFAQLALEWTVLAVPLACDSIPFLIAPSIRKWTAKLACGVMHSWIIRRRASGFPPFVHPLEKHAPQRITDTWPTGHIPFNIVPIAAQIL